MILNSKTRKEDLGLTNAVQAVQSHSLEGPPHHRILLQHLVEVVHRQRVKPTVVICSHAGCPPASCQQADLCKRGEKKKIIQTVSLKHVLQNSTQHF